ncbi:hypothetical protein [Caldimonas tepidiphila]|uniref:hypothetical protein n=1 Tax=Caldimonas tepidiphila TaxID=2315841 RepID=UPI000E5BAD1A|nr:hypothetical protein [Caldimonas tepidiphila]
MLRNFLRIVDRACDALTLLALPALALLWLSGLIELAREQWMQERAPGDVGALWQQAAVLYMAAIARSFTRDRAELRVRTLLDDWTAAGHERMRRIVSALCVWPWCLYVLWAGAPGRVQPLPAGAGLPAGDLALLQTALWCAALVLLLHSLLDIFAPRRRDAGLPGDAAGTPR